TLNGTTIADLIAQTAPQKPFAVAVNTQFVSKGAYAETLLNENDKVDIVRPVVGG
ncbi:sulfur carrier protein ThiS, partial [Neisseria sp. P0014.S009]